MSKEVSVCRVNAIMERWLTGPPEGYLILWGTGQTWLPPVFVNKVLLEHIPFCVIFAASTLQQ